MSRIDSLFEASDETPDEITRLLTSWFGDYALGDHDGEVLAQTLDDMVPGWESVESRDRLLDVLSDPRERVTLIPPGHALAEDLGKVVAGWREQGALADWLDRRCGSADWEPWAGSVASLEKLLARLGAAPARDATGFNAGDSDASGSAAEMGTAEPEWDEQAGQWRRYDDRDGEWEYHNADDDAWERFRVIGGTMRAHRYVEECGDWLPYDAASQTFFVAAANDWVSVDDPRLYSDQPDQPLPGEEEPEPPADVKAELDAVVENDLVPAIKELTADIEGLELLSESDLREVIESVFAESNGTAGPAWPEDITA